MAVGKSSLSRVARASVIPAPDKETETLIAKDKRLVAPAKPVPEKKAPPAPQNPPAASYALGDELPVWLL